jgi:hypothetical protein
MLSGVAGRWVIALGKFDGHVGNSKQSLEQYSRASVKDVRVQKLVGESERVCVEPCHGRLFVCRDHVSRCRRPSSTSERQCIEDW